jgi:hypothetical protein
MTRLKHPSSALGLRWFSALLLALCMAGRSSAQTVQESPERWLLIFDTSADMNRWLPGTTTELQNQFFQSMSGEMHPGDSVGVWTFAEKLEAGKYPLFNWMPGKASEEAASLVDFLDYEKYKGKTKFAALRPALRQVIADSQRLTILIFCDGKDEFKLTPYDEGINETFRVMQADRKKVKAPFVVVVRTQNGKFVGATVNLPPGSLSFPAFPPLPPAASVAPANLAPEALPVIPAPAPPAVPLVIVGTNVVTNQFEIKKLSGQ